eukprot:1888626-Rhodomonas_salina.3
MEAPKAKNPPAPPVPRGPRDTVSHLEFDAYLGSWTVGGCGEDGRRRGGMVVEIGWREQVRKCQACFRSRNSTSHD